MGTAIGAGTFFGIKLEEPSDAYSAGHPIPAGPGAIVTAPAAAPTVTASVGAGNITASVEYRRAYIKEGGFQSAPSAWSTPTALSAKNAVLSDIGDATDATVIGEVIERRIGTVRCVVARLWAGETTFTDTFSATSTSLDFSDRLNELNETGVNGEFKYPYVESADLGIDPKTITANVVTGGAGDPKGRPGPVALQFAVKGTANAGELAHYLATGGYTITKYGMKAAAWVTDLTDVDEPTRKYVITPKRAGQYGKGSISFHDHGGGENVNGFRWQNKASECVVKTDGGKVATMETKFTGIGYTPHGLPVATLDAGAPNSVTLPVLFGRRADALADTEVTGVKVTTGPSAGSLAVKVKDTSAGSYSGAAQTIAYNTTSKKMKQQSGMFSDKLRLLDQSGVAMGVGSGRPLMYLHGGDMTLIEANDEYVFPAKPLIPDTGTTPGTPDATCTGFGPKRMSAPDFTDANASVTDDGTGLMVTATQLKISDPKKLIEGHGIEASYGYDVQDTGKKNVELQFTRYFDDLSYQKRQELVDRSAFVWKLEGDRIKVTPGTYSAQRETVQVELTECEIKSSKATTGGEDVRMETVTVSTVEPTDGSSAFTITIITAEDVVIPA